MLYNHNMDIENKILEFANSNKTFKTSDVVKALEEKYTRQYVSSIINQLVRKGSLLKGGSTASAFYGLPANAEHIYETIKHRFKRASLEEHTVFNSIKDRHYNLKKLPENISSILFYAFTEMLNNAIEHSNSKYIEIEITVDNKNLTFIINDFGIGVFRSVMRKNNLRSEVEAMQDLLKGKTTTQPHSHSGEGIFFTSKVADKFNLDSFGYKMVVDNVVEDVFFQQVSEIKKGTRVTFVLSIDSKKHLNDVFNKFVTQSGEVGFDKTEILVRLFTQGNVYISRSQARRILSGLDKYKTIVLDFDRVTTIGQAFADEIFRVFQERYPDINIEPVNMIEPIKFMVDRVEKPIKTT
jgi:anti-sigma regulatory factor (Ser/Thr protein kinase)